MPKTTWLPEPAVDEYVDLADRAEVADSLSSAFLVLLERLSPDQRAIFLLHDVFSYSYEEVAAIVGKTPAACRQVGVRARRALEAGRPRFDASRQERDELARRFFAACRDGDFDDLMAMLAPDATFTGDGGGKGNGFPRPVVGRDRVGRVLRGSFDKLARLGIRPEPVHVGGQPGLRMIDGSGRTVAVWSLVIAGGLVVAIHGVVNPDKLAHLPGSVPAHEHPSAE